MTPGAYVRRTDTQLEMEDMTRTNRCAGALFLIALSAHHTAAQVPQFKANVKLTNGADGSTANGTMYFGGAKMRTELSMDGQNVVVIADPSARTQVVLMPADKVYMQMAAGQGPISVPVTGPSDPTNPCSSGGNTDCVKGPAETINGQPTVRWDYTSQEGVRTRAWISTKLRFPIKTSDDNGSAMEFTNIAEGAQRASLFSIPAGYTKMDLGMGGMTAGMGRGAGRGNPADPMAAAMANLPPEARAAMAAAMRGQNPAGAAARGQPPASTAAATGSAWERTKGWVLGVTITGAATKDQSGEMGTSHEVYSAKYVASIPLNYGTPAVPGFTPVGATWTHIAGVGGSPEVLAKPLTVTVEVKSRTENSYKGKCPIDEDPYTAVSTMENTAQRSASIATPDVTGFRVQANFKLSPDLKTYDLMAVFGLADKEEIHKRIDGKACRTGQTYTKNESSTRDGNYDATVELKDLPLPATMSAVSGVKKVAMTLGGRPMDATINWTLTPIR